MNKKIVSALSLATFVMFQLSAKPMSFASTNPGVFGWVKAVLIAIGTLVLLTVLLMVLLRDDTVYMQDSAFAYFFILLIFIIASFFIFPTIWCGLFGGGLSTFFYIYFYVKKEKAKEMARLRIKHDAHLLFEANKDYFMEILELVGGEDNIASIPIIGYDNIEVELKTKINNNRSIVSECQAISYYTFDGILLNLKCSPFGDASPEKIYYALELAIEETRAEKEKQRQNEEKEEEEKKQKQHQLEEQREAIVAQQKEVESQREEESRLSQLKKLVKKVEDAVLLFQSSVDKKEPVNLQLLKMIEDALSEMQSCKNKLEKHDIEELKRNKKYCKIAFEEAKKLEGFTQSANVRMDEILKMFDDVSK